MRRAVVLAIVLASGAAKAETQAELQAAADAIKAQPAEYRVALSASACLARQRLRELSIEDERYRRAAVDLSVRNRRKEHRMISEDVRAMERLKFADAELKELRVKPLPCSRAKVREVMACLVDIADDACPERALDYANAVRNVPQ